MGLNVIKISASVIWGDNLINYKNIFNFEQLMIEICNIVSKNTSNTLLFYHEFIGTNVIILEHLIRKKSIGFDSNKICIDITRGSDLSCYFNLSNPEFYPIVSISLLNKLKYINPNILSNDKKSNIISQYKKFTNGFDNNTNSDFSKINMNYLFQIPEEIILCFQIIKHDKILLNHILDGIISLIRYFYVCTDNEKINMKMYGINYLFHLQYNIENQNSIENPCDENPCDGNIICCLDKINNIIENIQFIDELNCNKHMYVEIEYENNINIIKQKIICNLFDIIKGILIDIFTKYKIDVFKIHNFIENLKGLSNKYDMMENYKKFIAILDI